MDKPPDWLQEPTKEDIIVLAVVVVLFAIVLSVTLLVLWRRRHGGPHQQAARLVVLGHQRHEDAREEALAKYCEAFEIVCAGAGDATRMDELLMAYNAAMPRNCALAFALLTEAAEERPPCSFVTVDFGDGGLSAFGAELDMATRRVVAVVPGTAAVNARVSVGDELQVLNGKNVRLEPAESLQEMLQEPGAASFCRAAWADMGVSGPSVGGDSRGDLGATAEGDFSRVIVCSRCATQNGVATLTETFQCLSCQATAVPWDLLVTAARGSASGSVAAKLRSHHCLGREPWRRPWVEAPALSWEASGLSDLSKHPTGCGRASAAPKDCRHHRQTGAQCGMAAVNNLMTNCSSSEVDAQYMLNISKMLGRAEAQLRNGEDCAHEQGEQRPLADFYATAGAEHFDVQTLQIAFDRHGFSMWYMNSEALLQRRPSNIFSHDGPGELVGYVLHRKDKLTSWRDHWFVLRGHGRPLRPLLQDSLHDDVFFLTDLEAHQLLLSLPQGSIFAVSKLPEHPEAGAHEGAGSDGSELTDAAAAAAGSGENPTLAPTTIGAPTLPGAGAPALPGHCPSE